MIQARQKCDICKRIFTCNLSCGLKEFGANGCLCLNCFKKENLDKPPSWFKEWIEHDPCGRKLRWNL